MGIFNKTKRKSNVSDVKIQSVKLQDTAFTNTNNQTEAMVPLNAEQPSLRASEQVRDINALKQDVSRMGDALRESMRLNQDTVGEMQKFANFLKIAEVNTINLERLQPENMELKADLENMRNELAKKQLWASELESKSQAYKTRFEETHGELEHSQTELAKIVETLNVERKHLSEANDSLEIIREERRELRSMVGDVQTENTVLQDTIGRLTVSENDLLRQKTELIKRAEVLSAKIEDERRLREVATSDIKNLRLDFAELKANHMETLSKFDKARHNAQSNENALAEFRQRSEDRIFALTSAIDGMKAQQKINEDMARYDEQEKAKLKIEAELENRRVKELTSRLDIRAKEQEEGHSALARAKANYDQLNTKYLTLLSDMESLRNAHKLQSQKLEEYSSISGVAVGQSFFGNSEGISRGKSTRTKTVTPQLKLVKDAPEK